MKTMSFPLCCVLWHQLSFTSAFQTCIVCQSCILINIKLKWDLFGHERGEFGIRDYFFLPWIYLSIKRIACFLSRMPKPESRVMHVSVWRLIYLLHLNCTKMAQARWQGQSTCCTQMATVLCKILTCSSFHYILIGEWESGALIYWKYIRHKQSLYNSNDFEISIFYVHLYTATQPGV